MTSPVKYDDSLPALARAIERTLGAQTLRDGVAVRDVVGRLSFFAARPLTEKERIEATESLRALGPYARRDRAVAGTDEDGVRAILDEAGGLYCQIEQHVVRVHDRRLVGADWVRSPAPMASAPVRFVFSSLKGGVGRSTALCVIASQLASKGLRVLAVDLDLEAPGIGAMLLTDDTTPEFGTLDYLVESALTECDDKFFADLLGPSALGTGGGRIDVIPAFGRSSLRNPADVISKLGRAYVESENSDGTQSTLLDRVRALVDRFSMPSLYDVILIDSRAGLHEISAAALLGLGADVFLFGVDEYQTFHGYSSLIAHLSRFIDDSGVLPEWVDRLTPVQAKAPADPDKRAEFRQKWQDLVTTNFPVGRDLSLDRLEVAIPDGFSDVPWDETRTDAEVLPSEPSIMQPICILRDDRYESFDPLRSRDVLSTELVRTTFGEIIAVVEQASLGGDLDGE